MSFSSQLSLYKIIYADPLLFSESFNTVNSIKGQFSGVSFNEHEIFAKIKDIGCFGNIINIRSSAGEVSSERYIPKIKDSNRGRKKIMRIKKYNKNRDPNKNFGSQITFVLDRTDKKKKEYKLLLFRNGNFTLTGVPANISEIMADLLNEMVTYLRHLWNFVRSEPYLITMRNYKFNLLNDYRVNLSNLNDLLKGLSKDVIIIEKSVIKKFMMDPIFDDENLSPDKIGWNHFVSVTNVHASTLYAYFIKNESTSRMDKTIRINTYRLANIINEFVYFYHFYVNLIKNTSVHNMNRTILEYFVDRFLADKYINMHFHDENLIRSFSYNSEEYPGLVFKIYTPTTFDGNRKTCVIMFCSGKININGAASKLDADIIKQWLNHFLTKYFHKIVYNQYENLISVPEEEPLFKIL
jgi:TATA-box binding protein (TBP) (component of TFIID and TFIIIB)